MFDELCKCFSSCTDNHVTTHRCTKRLRIMRAHVCTVLALYFFFLSGYASLVEDVYLAIRISVILFARMRGCSNVPVQLMHILSAMSVVPIASSVASLTVETTVNQERPIATKRARGIMSLSYFFFNSRFLYSKMSRHKAVFRWKGALNE